ncbi:transmembrane protein 254 [Elysia marginata]|uniref:Transmembrane protein 254 n=1 Tax=Elysia marginata TaxID=1093978 RepID=A0AAV4J025_9GAST|nr:transmembrane protein 254 [Elysia marginata]
MVRRGRIGLDRNYFALPHLFWMIVLAPSLAFLLVTAFSPDLIPPSLGVVRTASFYVYENFPYITWLTAVAAIAAHIFEGLYTIKLCYDADMTTSATIKWTISTLLFGFSSILLRLRPYLQKAKRSQF